MTPAAAAAPDEEVQAPPASVNVATRTLARIPLPRSVLVADGAVWATAHDDGVLYRLRASDDDPDQG